jgi:hypothetical protein
MGWGVFFEVVNAFCLCTRLVDLKPPVCTFDSDEQLASIGVNDLSLSIKTRLMALPDTVAIQVPEGPIGKAEAEAIMTSAVSVMRAQATIGPDAMSEDELETFMAKLMAPEPTTMLTVATSMPTTH